MRRGAPGVPARPPRPLLGMAHPGIPLRPPAPRGHRRVGAEPGSHQGPRQPRALPGAHRASTLPGLGIRQLLEFSFSRWFFPQITLAERDSSKSMETLGFGAVFPPFWLLWRKLHPEMQGNVVFRLFFSQKSPTPPGNPGKPLGLGDFFLIFFSFVAQPSSLPGAPQGNAEFPLFSQKTSNTTTKSSKTATFVGFFPSLLHFRGRTFIPV